MSATRAAALCVLGCRSGSPALERRARAAVGAFLADPARAGLVVACGGLSWAGRVEADEIARILEQGGVPPELVVRERTSRDTAENAHFTAQLLAERGVASVVIVTCSWHVRRARRLFERAGLRVDEAIGVPPPNPSVSERVYWAAREHVATAKDLFLGGTRR